MSHTTGELGTASYTYGSSVWGDLLLAYNGTAIQYDGSGNPLVHGSTHYSWEHGRQLESMLKNGVTWNYTYNNAGLRTGRYVQNGTAYKYVYNGGQLVRMTKDDKVVDFTYDASGKPLTMKVYTETEENGTTVTKCDTYYYVTNIQGDVMALVNASGATVASYSYTAYGVVTATGDATVIALNPLTYRGYVYDAETGLYYLQSRYYDPAIGRFINADAFVSTGQGILGNNMFAYCLNNPVNRIDLKGNASWIVGAAVAAGTVLIIGADHLLAKYQPEDGYAVRKSDKNSFVQWEFLHAQGNGFEVDANGITVCDMKIGVYDAYIGNDECFLEFIDLLSATAVAEVDWSGVIDVDISANASVYSPSAGFEIQHGKGSVSVEIEAYVLGAGAGIEFDIESGKLKITPPFAGVLGYSISLDFDWAS